MAVTSLKIEKNGLISHMQFITDVLPEGVLRVLLYTCNSNFEPKGGPPTEKSGFIRDEEEYHRALRIAASEHGHYVPEYSTDPQWNPNYIEPEDGEDNNDQAAISSCMPKQQESPE